MKKKDIKKISKIISDDVFNKLNDPFKIPPGLYGTTRFPAPGEVNPNELIDYLDYDEEISNKFFKFACSIIKLKDKINLSITESTIIINGSLDGKQNPPSAFSFGTPDDFLDVCVTKEGFRMSRGYCSKISYKDESMLDRLRSDLKERNISASRDSIIDMIDDIMVKTNLSRESNIDEILDEKINLIK